MKKQLIAFVFICVLTMPMFFGIANAEPSLKIPIITYHHLSDNPSDWNPSTVSTAKFKTEMVALKDLGYTPIHFNDVLRAEDGKTTLPKHPILITFDDGYLSNYKLAYPILKQLNMKATISVIGINRGRGAEDGEGMGQVLRHFSWEQAREMYNSGLIDIQYHTYDMHKAGDGQFFGRGMMPLQYENAADYAARLTADMTKMIHLIESEIGNKVIVCTYPYGMYTAISEKVAKKTGFRFSLTTNEGISNFADTHFLLQRLNMDSFTSSKDLVNRLLKLDGRDIENPIHTSDEDDVSVNEIFDNTTEVTGKTTANNEVFVTAGRRFIGSGTAKEDGSFLIRILPQLAGQFLTISTAKPTGEVTNDTRAFVVDLSPPQKPEITFYDEKTHVIKGVGEKGSTVEIRNKGTLLGRAKVNLKGEFTLKTNSLKSGTILMLVAKDRAGNMALATYTLGKPTKKV
jgi:peptidoglycan/xylan/chitin deacetylase (PgdA/CDA1 family)